MVFDVGGVLLDWDPRHLYRKLISDPAEMEWFLANVCTPQWHAQHDRGLSTAESCAALAEEWPQYAGLILAWSERGEEMVARPLPDGVKLLRQVIGSGLPCYALTNMEAETYPKRVARYDFLRCLSWHRRVRVRGDRQARLRNLRAAAAPLRSRRRDDAVHRRLPGQRRGRRGRGNGGHGLQRTRSRSLRGWGCRHRDICASELFVTGDLAEVAFERLRFDTFVLGACGIDARNGVTTHLPADARVKRAAVASSARTIIAADWSKLGVVTFGHVCPLSAGERLVTDAPPDDTADLERPGFIVQRV